MEQDVMLSLDIGFWKNKIVTKSKAISRKKLVAFVLLIIRKEKLPMNEELEKLRHKQYVAEYKLTAAKHKEKRL